MARGRVNRAIGPHYLAGVVLRQWFTIFILLIVIGVPLSVVIVLFRTPQYQSTALLVFDRTASEFRAFKESRGENDVDTQVEMLNALSVVDLVMTKLAAAQSADRPTAGLPNESTTLPDKHADTWIGVSRDWLRWVRDRWQAKPLSSPAPQFTDAISLQRQFRIRRRGMTDVISIEARGETPERAAQLANLYAEVYLAEQLSARLASAERIEDIVSRRMKLLSAELALGGPNTQLRTDLSLLSETLAAARQRRHVVAPELRVAAAALPIPILAFPSPRVLLFVGWTIALVLAVAVSAYRDQRQAIAAIGRQ